MMTSLPKTSRAFNCHVSALTIGIRSNRRNGLWLPCVIRFGMYLNIGNLLILHWTRISSRGYHALENFLYFVCRLDTHEHVHCPESILAFSFSNSISPYSVLKNADQALHLTISTWYSLAYRVPALPLTPPEKQSNAPLKQYR